MRKNLHLLLAATATFTFVSIKQLQAQNTSPYWSLAGNSNASNTTSKLGTTNAINLRMFANNIERMRILSSNGYVGIGTTAPTDRLHINTPSGTNALRVQVNAATKLLVHSSGGVTIGASTAPPANGLYVAGNVGIGTATPAYKLQVNGNASVSSGLYVGNNGVYGYNSGGPGVYASGSSYGTYAKSIDGPGVFAESTNNYGLQASSTTTYGILANGYSLGVYGYGSSSTSTAYGMYGYGYTTAGGSSDIAVGVYGIAYNASGTSRPAYGVYGIGLTGMYGLSNDGGGTAVYARATAVNGYGLVGSSQQAIGVYGYTGNTASWAGYFLGRVFSTSGFTTSDRKLKQDISDLNSAMDIIGKLQPKTYKFRQDGNYRLMNMPQGTHYGLIAQDVEQLLPDLVTTADFNTARVRPLKQVPTPKGVQSNAPVTTPDQSSMPQEVDEVIEFKTLNYTELIPIMIKGMQEQQQENEELKARISKLEDLVSRLSDGQTVTTAIGMGSLEQNSPNPVTGATIIRYRVPETINSAHLIITNVKGQVIKTITLGNRGAGQLNLSTVGLASGTYNYTLYVDGKAADTKRLVVAR